MADMEHLERIGKLTQFRSGGEAAEIGRLGGIASGQTRRRRKTMRKVVQELLSLKPTDADTIDRLEAYGLSGDSLTYGMAISIAMLEKALAGDVNAARFIRDTVGESPAEIIQNAALKHQKNSLEYRKEHDLMREGYGLEIEDLSETDALIYGEKTSEII